MSKIETKTWGEREGISLEFLTKFVKAGDPVHGTVHQVWNYRGDCTQTGDERRERAIGKAAYEHEHWDAVAFNGGVIVIVPRWKFGTESKLAPRLQAPCYWAMKQICQEYPEPKALIRPCTKKEIQCVVPETQALLAELPGLEYMQIKKVSFFSTSKKGLQWMAAPKGLRFFRFAAGYGAVAIQPEGA